MTIDLKVKIAWWLKPYFFTLKFFCILHNCMPDEEKLRKIIRRAINLRLVKS